MFSDLIGKPYKRFGRGPHHYDCYGLVRECLRRAGLPLPPDYAEVDPMDADTCNGTMACEIESGYLPVDRPAFGDIVMMRFNERGTIRSHPGFMDSESTFITTTGRTGAMRVDIADRFWGRFIEGFYRAG